MTIKFRFFKNSCLHFSEPPSFNDKKCSGDATVPEKHSAKFICSVNGYPNPKISWKREDDKIISGNVKEGNF